MLIVDASALDTLADGLVALAEKATTSDCARSELLPIADRKLAKRLAEQAILNAVPLVRYPTAGHDVAIPEGLVFLSQGRDGLLTFPPSPKETT